MRRPLVGLALAACAATDTSSDTTGGSSSDASTSAASTGDPAPTTSDTSGPAGSSSAGATTSTTDVTTTDATTDATTGPATGCGGGLAPGKHTDLALDVDGVARTYELFVPPGYDPAVPAPLVLNFHGLLYTPAGQADFSGFDASAGPRGMLVAYPAGLGNSFNSGACCGQAHEDGVDDVGFARALVAEVQRTHCVDPKRVYVTGMSNGGHMAHLLACVAADVFAAAASVTGVLQLDPADCTPARPITVLDFHGTGDPIVPYTGGGAGYPPVPAMMADWAARNACTGASVVGFEEGDMRCETWPGCDGGVDVTLCTIDGGGHCWPGPGACPFGHNSSARVASDVIADLFLAHPLP